MNSIWVYECSCIKDRVANNTVFVPQAGVNEARTVVVHHTTAVLPYSFVLLGIVSPILGVRIPDVQKYAVLGAFRDCALSSLPSSSASFGGMMVSLHYIELKRALLILLLTGSHSNRVLPFPLATIRATPLTCCSSCPAYRMAYPISWRTEPVQRHSVTLRMSGLYLFIPMMSQASLDVSYMAWTFQVPMRIISSLWVLSHSWLPIRGFHQQWLVILPSGWLECTMGTVEVLFVVVSVTW